MFLKQKFWPGWVAHVFNLSTQENYHKFELNQGYTETPYLKKKIKM